MRYSLLTIMLLVASVCGIDANAMARSWDAGPLTWNDFRAVPAMKESPAFMSAVLLQNARTVTKRGMQTLSIEAQAVMYPEQSYASENVRSEQQLRYFQAQFDLLELLRRRYQNELAGGISGIEADRRLTYYNNLYKTELERLASETDNGTDDSKLQYMEYDLRRQLEDIGAPDVPVVSPSPWRYGLFIGLGASFPTSGISEYFSGAFDFTFGALVSYRRFNLEASITYGSPTVRDPWLTKAEYADKSYYANVKNANYLAIGFNGGFSVLNTKRFTIAPYVGGMWTGYSWTARPAYIDASGAVIMDGLQKKMDIGDFNVCFGINFEWHFHSVVTNFPIFGSMREEYISSLRITPYANRAVYTGASRPIDGWNIGFMVSYSGVGRALGIK